MKAPERHSQPVTVTDEDVQEAPEASHGPSNQQSEPLSPTPTVSA